MKAGWWAPYLMLRDLAEGICMFNTLNFLSKYSFTTIRPDFINLSYFIYLSIIIPPHWFKSFIDTTIRPKYMALFHLGCFLLCTTVQLKITVFIANLFKLYAHDIILFLLRFSARLLNDEFL